MHAVLGTSNCGHANSWLLTALSTTHPMQVLHTTHIDTILHVGRQFLAAPLLPCYEVPCSL